MRDYFQFYGVPDLWIMSAPFHHEAWKWNKNEHGQNMKTFKYLISTYLPASTKLVILPDSRECMASMPRRVFEDLSHISNYSKNVITHYMNQMLYEALETTLVANNTNVYGFLDIGILACPFTCHWHSDGAHMVQLWYDHLMILIFQYLCAS